MQTKRKKPIHPYLLALGAEIKSIRTLRKLSLEAVGSEIGLDAANLQKIENGQNLTISTLMKICICLHVTPSRLLERIPWNLTEKDLDKLTTPRNSNHNPVKSPHVKDGHSYLHDGVKPKKK